MNPNTLSQILTEELPDLTPVQRARLGQRIVTECMAGMPANWQDVYLAMRSELSDQFGCFDDQMEVFDRYPDPPKPGKN